LKRSKRWDEYAGSISVAGNIGRGLFSQLLHESGYDICFVDVREDVVEALKTKGRYDVVMTDEAGEHISVDRITAFQSKNEADEVTQRLVEADLITTVIGSAVLPVIASAIADGDTSTGAVGGGGLWNMPRGTVKWFDG
jgi:mannitol-1-phosphate 5-dehydrogenase